MAAARPRKQSQVCVQCKRSKKRCDGYVLNAVQRTPAGSTSLPWTLHGTFKKTLQPCTYCKRTLKDCSFNSSWAVSADRDSTSPASNVPLRVHGVSRADFTPGTRPSSDTSTSSTDSSRSQIYNLARQRPPAHILWRLATPPSPFSTESSLASCSSNQPLVQSLLQIYHDVMENNLACWVTDSTCPYMTSDMYKPPVLGDPNGKDSPAPEWGASWSNRMYQCVLRLDRAAQPTMIHLTPIENRAASRALELAIMSFSSQWQGGQRMESFPSASPNHLDSPAERLALGLEQSLRDLLWKQARTALQEVSELECFRVIYAEFIFGLTQRPWTDDDFTSTFRISSVSSRQDTLESEIARIFSQENSSVYLDRAVRKAHALKYRFDTSEAGLFQESEPKFSPQDRQGIGFLYWLLVMHDTVCSPMNERPVVLADEDCVMDALKQHLPAQGSSGALQVNYRWKLDMFLHDDPDSPQVPRWPCSYATAAKAIIKSTPIKILLYRYVFYLQNAIKNKESKRSVENCLQGAVSVCRYWDMTYSPFFSDLVRNYGSVPPRLKSWFVCIHVAWNLGMLLLADLIDLIDDKGMSNKTAAQARRSIDFVARIRMNGALELSELARADTASKEALPGYHFAVQESPLLTEPCTAIFIRGFMKASLYYLSLAADLWGQEGVHHRDFNKHQGMKDSLMRLDACLRALWCLGRKSGLARRVTSLMLREYYRLQESLVEANSP
ncbi:hypothetical protein CDV36_007174 [Fusarium kuroshium]|uniref:Zn(2)-C6 fungal-type domain-containing protein n=1 Tax=Fusarium kuroshium TaxID=2010991 RepID=A0A3M2S6L2_9HYPO|nr:hypothetical protein CDV36_007174 [Fusarium kuroshium]